MNWVSPGSKATTHRHCTVWDASADSLASDLHLRAVFDSSFAVREPCLSRLLSMLAATTGNWLLDDSGRVITALEASSRTRPPQLNCTTPNATAISTVLLVAKTAFDALRQITEWRDSFAFDVPSDMQRSRRSGLLRRSKRGSKRSAAGSGRGGSWRPSRRLSSGSTPAAIACCHQHQSTSQLSCWGSSSVDTLCW